MLFPEITRSLRLHSSAAQRRNNLFSFYEGNPINLHDPLLQCLGRNFYIVNNWSLVGAWHLETFMADGIPFL